MITTKKRFLDHNKETETMVSVFPKLLSLRLCNLVRKSKFPLISLRNETQAFHVSNGLTFSGCQFFSTARNEGEKPPQRPKTVPKPMVTLLGPDKGAMTVVLLEEAEKMAKRRNLRLEKVSDIEGKHNRATYRLIGHQQLDKKPSASGAKSTVRIAKIEIKEKQLTISSKIGDHDLNSKLAQLIKWVEKRIDIKVTINGAEAELVYEKMESKFLEAKARILQKRMKGDNMKFTLSPPKEVKTAETTIEDNIKTAE